MQYLLDDTHAIIEILPELIPNDEEFSLWGQILLTHEAFEQLEFEQGADRHLIRFLFKEQRFNLNFEHYSESIWINADGVFAEQILPELLRVLEQQPS